VLTVAPNGNRVLRTSGLFFGSYPRLDLNDNDLIVDYTAAAGNISPLGGWNHWNYTGIAGMIETGRGQNGWGIVTTHPDALGGLTTLGVGEASQVLGLSGSQTGTFAGQTVDATTVLVKYTLAADADLDGAVGFADLTRLAQNYNSSAGGSWAGGDFNYDGRIDFADLVILAQNYNKGDAPLAQAPAAPLAAASASSIEPSVLSGGRRRNDQIFNLAAPIRRPAPAAKAGRAIR
jgi:hypothetical protein